MAQAWRYNSAVCVSMLTMTLLGFTGSVQKFRAGAIDLRAATVIAIFGVLFGPLGAWLNKQVPPVLLLVLFTVAALAISIRVLLQREVNAKRPTKSHDVMKPVGASVFRSGAAGAAIGLLGGLLGISGGFIAVPVLVTDQGMEMHRAVASSWAIVALVSASATIGHIVAGQRVPPRDALLFLMGGIIGFEIAMRVAHRFSGAGLKRLFGAAILMMSVVMLVRLLAG